MALRSAATPNTTLPLAAVGAIARLVALTGATLTTGLISGFFYAYARWVTLGLALLAQRGRDGDKDVVSYGRLAGDAGGPKIRVAQVGD